MQVSAVFDARTGMLQLVAGDAEGDTEFVGTPQVATGQISVGRGLRSGTWGEWWPGSVSDVQVWTGAMDLTNEESVES